jgi:hypothetical protein
MDVATSLIKSVNQANDKSQVPLVRRAEVESVNYVRASYELVEFGMTNLEKLEQEVILWPEVSVHSHRFGGREFRFRSAEIGHVHVGGVVDIPFPRSIRDALLDEGDAETHHWVPDSGWITFRVRSEDDLKHALWLMRVSYLRYALKTAADASEMFQKQVRELRLSPRFKSLLKPFVPQSAKEGPTQTVHV